jgi:hypothetical protein
MWEITDASMGLTIRRGVKGVRLRSDGIVIIGVSKNKDGKKSIEKNKIEGRRKR